MGCHGANADLSHHSSRGEYCGGKETFPLFRFECRVTLLSTVLSTQTDDAQENLFARYLEWLVKIMYGIAYSLYR
jgi:pyridoxal/pyridoxine/pyridoxamine kinase